MSLLEIRNLCKGYGKRQVLHEVSYQFTVGLTLLTGPSGAGKSTLLRLLATAESPTTGAVFWNGIPLPQARRSLRQSLGYAPQAVELPEDLTAREFAMHMAALKGLELGPADHQFLAITHAIGLHADIHNKISTFSGGMRRRLIFAQAMLGAPSLLVLDEPTAELDRDTAGRVDLLVTEYAQRAVVIMTTHLADDLPQQANAVLRVEAGTVIAA